MGRKPNKSAGAKKDAAAASGSLRDALAAVPAGWMAFAVCLLLAAATWSVFERTLGYDFVPYDDGAYVYDNPEVVHGVSLKTIGWAFSFSHRDLYLWTPLTRISHMVDCQIFGLTPWGHHLTNVLLHIATAAALFVALWLGTGKLWSGAFVAAVFAIHPLRAESVAWISERKDVLSGLFFALALVAYVFYVRKRTVWRYAAVAAAFALGLLAKQMVVTLPCVLLLLDYWPLGRFNGEGGGLRKFPRLLAEKVPLFALSAASCAQSFMGRTLEPGTVVKGLNQISSLRIENALVSYLIYIGKLFYPVKLAVYYPYPESVPAWQVCGAVAVLAGVSVAVFLLRKTVPALLVGWLWYIGMLVPVIGFIPLGKEGHADRYTYLPEIGLCIMAAWGVSWLTRRLPRRGELLCIAAALVIAVLARFSAEQAAYWQNGVTLWKHAFECTPDNAITRDYLGNALQEAGRDDEAIVQLTKSIGLNPNFAEPENILGIILFSRGDVDGAIRHFKRALQINAGHIEARNNLAFALIQKGDYDEAERQLRLIIQNRPNHPGAKTCSMLGGVLLHKGDVQGAIAMLQRALDINPDLADAHVNLGSALLQDGEPAGAVYQFQKALKIAPDNLSALLSLAQLFATFPDDRVRDGIAAVGLALRADELSGHDPHVLNVLAAAFAEAGRFPDAIETARRALELATAGGDTKLANDLQARLALYRSNTPLRLPLKQSSAK